MAEKVVTLPVVRIERTAAEGWLYKDVERAQERSAELAEMSDAQRVDRLRSELAQVREILGDRERELATWRNIAESHEPATRLRQAEFTRMDSELDRLRAELVASDTIGNNLQGEIKILVGKLGVACAEIETLRKRVAELERPLENAGVYGNAGRYWEGRYRDEAARAEQAEAQLTCCQNDKATLKALTEQAEAEADSLRTTIDNMRAMNIKLTFEATGKVLAAEERDAAFKLLEPRQVWDIQAETRAALNPPPAGREG